MRGLEVDSSCTALRDLLEDASNSLTLEQIAKARGEVSAEAMQASAARNGTEGPHHAQLLLSFPEATMAAFTFAARQALRKVLAASAQLPLPRVTLEQVSQMPTTTCAGPVIGGDCQSDSGQMPSDDSSISKQHCRSTASEGMQVASPDVEMSAGLRIEIHVSFGSDLECCQHFCESFVTDFKGRCDEAMAKLIGPLDLAASSAVAVDMSAASRPGDCSEPATDSARLAVPKQDNLQLATVQRPKLELALPYASYSLCRADGSTVERADKHPFCMSRVYYDASERPEEIWAQHSDGSCRWRQTGSEVKIIALKVPPKLPPKQLQVTLEPYFIRVCNRTSGEVYLEGALERGIAPAQSVWTHGGGSGEDGCLLLLHKMNLELLRRHWMHSEMWWPRLFSGGPTVEWDDYEKDYSDLPAPVLAAHRAAEAIKDVDRKLEASEKTYREKLQEADDLRKRTRQARLKELRQEAVQPWAQLLAHA